MTLVAPQTMRLADLPTPALVVDASIVRRNIDRMARYCAQHRLGLRPHTKTHKSRVFAKMQLDAGALGLTVAKVGEAEQMAMVCDELLLAYPAVDAARAGRLAKLARTKHLLVAIDTATAAEAIAAAARSADATIGLLVDLDVGMGRTGTASPPAALDLAQRIVGMRGVRLDGILCYPGHIWSPSDQQGPALAAVAATLEETIERWRRSGLEARIVSGGSTPTAYQSHLVPQYTEIRPGTYIFNDMNELRAGYATLDDCAARIIATVVSDSLPNQVILDGGAKTFASDLCIPNRGSGHGYIVEYPQAKITHLSEEHGQVDVSALVDRPRIGERVSVVPNHICPCVNLHDNTWWLEADGTVRSLCVDARGKLS